MHAKHSRYYRGWGDGKSLNRSKTSLGLIGDWVSKALQLVVVFPTIMWPEKVLRQFQAIPPNPQEWEFHGPYNKLLYTLFPADSDFTVVPQYLKPSSRDSVDFIVSFEVLLQNYPVFVLELRPPPALNNISTRGEADDQIRRRIGDLAGRCPLATLHAVSALGTKLSFYSLDTTDDNADIIPRAIARHPTRVNDYAPAERWSYDILEEGGEAQLRSIIEEVQQGCAHLVDQGEVN